MMRMRNSRVVVIAQTTVKSKANLVENQRVKFLNLKVKLSMYHNQRSSFSKKWLTGNWRNMILSVSFVTILTSPNISVSQMRKLTLLIWTPQKLLTFLQFASIGLRQPLGC